MNISEHLNENQLRDYFGDALENEAKHRIGRHLLQCDFCLERLPQPTAEQFWAALMTENDVEDSPAEKATFPARLGLIIQSLKQPKIFNYATGALAAALIFTVSIWLGSVKLFDGEIEVAENFEAKNTEFITEPNNGGRMNLPPELQSFENDGSFTSAEQNRVTESEQDLPLQVDGGEKQNRKIISRNDSAAKTERETPTSEKKNISLTRGGFAGCGDRNSVDSEIGADDKTVILKWKKVPGAAKYHLYFSDEEEVLIDEYETETETSYVLAKPLDPKKTYRWKIAVTLENGQTIVGGAQQFSVENVRRKQKKSEGKGKMETRCLAND